jgi:hypothetical protein
MTYHPETPDIVSCFHELSPVVPSGTSPCARLRTAHPHPSSPALRIRFASTSSGRSIRARLRPPRDCCCSVGNLAVPFKTGSARDSDVSEARGIDICNPHPFRFSKTSTHVSCSSRVSPRKRWFHGPPLRFGGPARIMGGRFLPAHPRSLPSPLTLRHRAFPTFP